MPKRPTVRQALEALLQTYYTKTGTSPDKKRKLNREEKRIKNYFTHLARSVKKNPKLLGAIAPEYRVPTLCDLAIKKSGLAIADIPPEHQTIERFFNASKLDPEAIRYAPDELRPLLETKLSVDRMMNPKKYFRRINNMFEVIREYFTPKPDPLEQKLLRCLNIINGVDCEGYSRQQLENELKENFIHLPDNLKLSDFCKKVIRYNPSCAAYLPDSERTSEMMQMLIKHSPLALENIPLTRRNVELCLIAYLKNEKALEFVPPALKVEVVEKAEKYEKEKNAITNQQDLEKFINHWGDIVPDEFIRKQFTKFAFTGSHANANTKSIKTDEIIQKNISEHLEANLPNGHLTPGVAIKA